MVSTLHKLNSKKTIQLKNKQKILDFWSRLLTKEYILTAVCIWKDAPHVISCSNNEILLNSATQTLCNHMDGSMPGLPVHHQLQ